jgi:hypothetical protein
MDGQDRGALSIWCTLRKKIWGNEGLGSQKEKLKIK